MDGWLQLIVHIQRPDHISRYNSEAFAKVPENYQEQHALWSYDLGTENQDFFKKLGMNYKYDMNQGL